MNYMELKELMLTIGRRAYLEYRFGCWGLNKRFRKSVTAITKQGRFTVLTADDAIGKVLYARRQYELELMTKATALLRNLGKCHSHGKGTIVDIGANNGVISVGMLYTGQFARAIAIEPEPRNFSLLQHNAKQNRFENDIICLPYAVSSQAGELLFELSNDNMGDHRVRTDCRAEKSVDRFGESDRQVTKVKSETLDNLLSTVPDSFSSTISLIWIDVQGYEAFVFLGARNVLSKAVPVVSEIWPYGMLRAGVSKEQYCDIAKHIWSSYWVLRRGRFVKYPIAILDLFYDELGLEGDSDNIIFTH
jgi:FkbM family methyltransferase